MKLTYIILLNFLHLCKQFSNDIRRPVTRQRHPKVPLREQGITPEPLEPQRRNFAQKQRLSSGHPVQSDSARFGANRLVDADPSRTASQQQLANGSSERLPVFGNGKLTPHLNSMGRVPRLYKCVFMPEQLLQLHGISPPVSKMVYGICIP